MPEIFEDGGMEEYREAEARKELAKELMQESIPEEYLQNPETD
jgi:hypothetical protein